MQNKGPHVLYFKDRNHCLEYSIAQMAGLNTTGMDRPVRWNDNIENITSADINDYGGTKKEFMTLIESLNHDNAIVRYLTQALKNCPPSYDFIAVLA